MRTCYPLAPYLLIGGTPLILGTLHPFHWILLFHWRSPNPFNSRLLYFLIGGPYSFENSHWRPVSFDVKSFSKAFSQAVTSQTVFSQIATSKNLQFHKFSCCSARPLFCSSRSSRPPCPTKPQHLAPIACQKAKSNFWEVAIWEIINTPPHVIGPLCPPSTWVNHESKI